MTRTKLLFALVVLASGCGFPKEQGERLMNEVSALQTQASAIQQALSELQETSKRQNESLTKLDREVAQLNSAARRNDADFGVQLDQALQSVARLRGQVESWESRLSTVESDVKKAQDELDLRFNNLAEQQRVQASSQAEKDRAEAERLKNERLLSNPAQLFTEVERLIGEGKAGDGRKLLREFMIRAKGDKNLEKSLADAQYYIGETYFAAQDWQQAASEYNNVRKNYSKSPRVPDALFKLGMCFEKLNLPDDAKLFYETIIQKHSKSSVAKDARARLAALK
ncbi:tetratricopeptide repeat protein [Myxococcota bacterium]|nr:tetratricopeptide repeat protein [Myxococcota bacterium]